MSDVPSPQLCGLARFVRALGHPSRLNILRLLAKEGGLSYDEIEAMTGLSNPTVRQHLKVLRRVEFVERTLAPAQTGAPRRGRKPCTHTLGEGVVGLHRDIDFFLWELRDPRLRSPAADNGPRATAPRA